MSKKEPERNVRASVRGLVVASERAKGSDKRVATIALYRDETPMNIEIRLRQGERDYDSEAWKVGGRWRLDFTPLETVGVVEGKAPFKRVAERPKNR